MIKIIKKAPFFLVVIATINFLHSQNKIQLQPGDFIFQTINCGPLCESINKVTSGYNNIDFNHIGMVYIKNNEIFILEAITDKVQLTPYKTFIRYTNKPMYVGRLKKRFQKYIPFALRFGIKQIGTPYDDAYLYNNNKYYCSELIYDAFLHARKKPLFKLYPMTFKEPNSEDYFSPWKEYYNNLNIPIPEGKLGCNPGGISKSNKIRILGVLH